MKKRKISRDEISQEFDLKELLGYEPNKRQKEMFGEILVNKIVSRTAGGDDVNNENFIEYSPKYAEKKGVTIEAVDLILSGDMLKSVFDESSKSSNIVKIEIDQDQIDKAYGHISGMKGHPTIKNGKKRDFFGFINKSEILDAVLAVEEVKEVTKPKERDRVRESEGLRIDDIRRAIFEEIKITFTDE